MRWQNGSRKKEHRVTGRLCGNSARKLQARTGSLTVSRLGAAVFSDAGKRKILNRIVHPAVLEEVSRDIAEKESGE